MEDGANDGRDVSERVYMADAMHEALCNRSTRTSSKQFHRQRASPLHCTGWRLPIVVGASCYFSIDYLLPREFGTSRAREYEDICHTEHIEHQIFFINKGADIYVHNILFHSVPHFSDFS